ncbi:hypothetical protein DN069_35670 [Streptacidiphilus pinicola]|uniref:Zinc-finger domain-containing protein n=1 Tax=Streptacidiphilus pinicola TaxID=2219663 RepID=A0A2X0IBY6_9ACTN|nr:hypothetical protein [Streptacidiphilus pinicola]RAG80891.1 hypothetical protein DN069_35670 [Streptacidiphilus pinicola]
MAGLVSPYEPRARPGHGAALWHITPQGDDRGLCGSQLHPVTEIRPIAEVDHVPGEQLCDACCVDWADHQARPEPA